MLEGATLAFHKPPAPKLSGRVQNTQNVPNSAKLCGHLNCYQGWAPGVSSPNNGSFRVALGGWGSFEKKRIQIILRRFLQHQHLPPGLPFHTVHHDDDDDDDDDTDDENHDADDIDDDNPYFCARVVTRVKVAALPIC